MGHIRTMSAVQPFISGAISKTVNMPNSATPEDIEKIYVESWRMGLKSVALYRDGCKSSQPLSVKKETNGGEQASEEQAPVEGQLELFPELAEYGLKRRRLPIKRLGFTVEAHVGGHKVYVRTGEYEDGKLGEIFIDMFKEGAAFRSMINCFAVAVSKGLQYGVPLREFVDTFTFTRFEPQGICDHPNIKVVNSVVDFVFRVLGMEYLGRTDFCQVKPDVEDDSDETAAAPEVGADERGDNPHQQPSPPLKSSDGNGKAPASRQGHAAEGKSVPRGTLGKSGAADIAAPREEAARVPAAERPARKGPATGGRAAQGAAIAGKSTRVVAHAAAPRSAAAARAEKPVPNTVVDRQLGELMGDAPFCDICGHITVRNGACYKCLNCGNSIGCS